MSGLRRGAGAKEAMGLWCVGLGGLTADGEPHEQRQSLSGRVTSIVNQFLFLAGAGQVGGWGQPGFSANKGRLFWRWASP